LTNPEYPKRIVIFQIDTIARHSNLSHDALHEYYLKTLRRCVSVSEVCIHPSGDDGNIHYVKFYERLGSTLQMLTNVRLVHYTINYNVSWQSLALVMPGLQNVKKWEFNFDLWHRVDAAFLDGEANLGLLRPLMAGHSSTEKVTVRFGEPSSPLTQLCYSLAALPRLKHLCLELHSNVEVTSAHVLAWIPSIRTKTLERLELNHMQFTNVEAAAELGQAISQSNITSLKLSDMRFTNAEAPAELGQAISLSNITSLNVDGSAILHIRAALGCNSLRQMELNGFPITGQQELCAAIAKSSVNAYKIQGLWLAEAEADCFCRSICRANLKNLEICVNDGADYSHQLCRIWNVVRSCNPVSFVLTFP
jgi:hypothetical protein